MQDSTSEYHDVVIIGAGLSGIGAACQLRAEMPDVDFIILEGRDRIGGTWDLFRYPGIRSDSDMHTLGYRFKPWKDAKAIADGPAILQYIRDTAAEYDIEERIRYRHHLVKADWSSDDCAWTLDLGVGEGGERRQIRCGFLLMCAGYYSYEHGHTPVFPGRERFAGPIVHPQAWPEELDYAGKRVVIIGSGATAVTLLPELARTAGHVTMLQRSPTYMIAFPDEDIIANVLGRILPAKLAYRITRWKNIRLQALIFRVARRWPRFARWFLVGHARRTLGPDFDVDKHFNPDYDPWEQRLCLIPNDDLFKTIRSGRASVVTDRIRTFTESGILLESGESIDADIIVTATGLDIVVLGGAGFHVDGKRVEFPDAFTYKGVMIEGVPNMISTFGYINASWTLRADLIARFSCRVLERMNETGNRKCVPVLRAEDEDMEAQPWVTGFSSGYLQRVMDQLPKQGDREPWLNSQNYFDDRRKFLEGTLDDGALRFEGAMQAEVDTAA
ncbi:MAG: FAD-dependent oxidoreductase [Gammaproteobacteria bacterium]|jgi:cation diffusion facilitator CzcD-associated flavoprotein CzcO|nr:FAD-dependent oxidoreductase [Gammaproteobacteria bacterium]